MDVNEGKRAQGRLMCWWPQEFDLSVKICWRLQNKAARSRSWISDGFGSWIANFFLCFWPVQNYALYFGGCDVFTARRFVFLFLPTQDVYLVFSSPLGENKKCFFSFSSEFILRSYPIAQPIPLCHRCRYFGCPEVIFLIHSAILLRLCFWALLDRTLDPRRDNGSCCFESCISGISFTLSKPSQLFSLMTNFSFPFCFYHENKGGKKYEGCSYLFIFFSMPQKLAGIGFRIFCPIRPFLRPFGSEVLNGRDSESLMRTASNCSRRLSTISGRWEMREARCARTLQDPIDLLWKVADEWVCEAAKA